MATQSDLRAKVFGSTSYQQSRSILVDDLDMSLKNTVTEYDSLCDSFNTDYSSYLRDASSANSYKQATGVISKMMCKCVKPLYPVSLATFLLSRVNQEKIRDFCESDEYLTTLSYETFSASDNKGMSSKDMQEYYNCTVRFRNAMGWTNKGLEVVTGSVKTRLAVGTNNLSSVSELLRDIVEQQKQRTGSSSGADHLTEFIPAIEGSWEQLPPVANATKERKQLGFAVEVRSNYSVRNVSNGRALLMSSAMAQYFRSEGGVEGIADLMNSHEEELENADPEVKKFYTRVCAEAVNFLENKKNTTGDDEDEGESGYVSQHANIDPVLLFGYITYTRANLTIDEFYSLQPLLYALSTKIVGPKKINEIMAYEQFKNFRGLARLKATLSGNQEIHCHPLVLTRHRFYDYCAPVCPFNLYNIRSTCLEPGVNYRSVLGFISGDSSALTFMVNLYMLEKTAYEKDGAPETRIFQSHRIFQQFLMGRIGPLTNTNQIVGNAIKVEIVA